jgi:CrcB protein
MAYLLVFLGGGLGAAARHTINIVSARLLGTAFPYGTLTVNVVGSLAMGLIAAYFAFKGDASQHWRLFIATGVLGGFTTFSAFSLDVAVLYQRGEVGLALGYVLASVVLSIAALFVGLLLVRSTGVIAVAAVAAGIVVYWREGQERFFAVLGSDVGVMVYMTPKVLAGCIIGALMTLLLPREVVTRWIGAESGILGFVIAFLAAALLPGNPLTIFPVAGALLLAGADVGAVVVFITTWAVIGYQRALVWELPFLGLDFMLWRILVCLPLPFIAGALARMLVRARKPGSAVE